MHKVDTGVTVQVTS